MNAFKKKNVLFFTRKIQMKFSTCNAQLSLFIFCFIKKRLKISRKVVESFGNTASIESTKN